MNNVFIHPTANVSKKVIIRKGTKNWINSQIIVSIEIGENCVISKDTYIDSHVLIGNNCKINNSVSVYYGVTIEDDIFVGQNAFFTNDKLSRAFEEDWKITPTLIKKGDKVTNKEECK